MVYGECGETVADSWWIVKPAQEQMYSDKLSDVLERGRSSCVCSSLLGWGQAEFGLRSGRFNRGSREGGAEWPYVTKVNDRSRNTIHKSYQDETQTQVRTNLFHALNSLLESRFYELSKPIRKNLAVLTIAFLHVLGAARSGYGQLSLALLARALPTEGTAHARENRLRRFLKNTRLDYRAVTSSLGKVLLSDRKGFCPVLFDQTKSGSTQALLAAVPYAGRALPLSCFTFDYPFDDPEYKSQPELEYKFLLNTERSLPHQVKPVWIGDRLYARSLLLKQSELEKRLYILRGRCGTGITYRGKRMKLYQLKSKAGKSIRYKNVLYHSKRKVKIDVVVFHDPDYKETWYLLVPVTTRSILSTDMVVELYRERMQIEQSFRDFKTHIGMRGLKLQTDIAPRMGRLLLSFCLTYVLCVLLGTSSLGEEARMVFEIPRHSPRHGTTRNLSALMLAMIMLSHPLWIQRSYLFLLNLICHAANGNSWFVNHSPP